MTILNNHELRENLTAEREEHNVLITHPRDASRVTKCSILFLQLILSGMNGPFIDRHCRFFDSL